MKNIYLLLSIVSFVITPSIGQDWNPFPYDSVYFINEDNPRDILIPVIKSLQPDELLQDMYVKVERGFIAQSVTDLQLTVTQSPSDNEVHWFGDQFAYDSGVLSFQSVFSNDVLNIDVMAPVGHVDSQSFYMDNNLFYLLTEIESNTFNLMLNDSIKTITLTLTDSLFSPKEYAFNLEEPSEMCTDLEMFNLGYSSENKQVQIGKNTGLQEIPNLAFYPFCRSFVKYQTILEVKSELLNHHLNVGDIIEGSDRDSFVGSSVLSYKHHKKTINSVQLDILNDEYVYITEYTEKSKPNTIDEVVNVYPQQVFKVKLWSDDFFTGVPNATGFGKMLRMESKWNYPYIQIIHQEPYPSGAMVFGQIGLVTYIGFGDATLPTLDTEVSGSQNIVDCITYYNIDGEEFGVEHMFSSEEFNQPNELIGVLDGSEIVLNKNVKGDIQIYQTNGQLLYTYTTDIDVKNIPINHLETGLYLVYFKHINKTLKLFKE